MSDYKITPIHSTGARMKWRPGFGHSYVQAPMLPIHLYKITSASLPHLSENNEFKHWEGIDKPPKEYGNGIVIESTVDVKVIHLYCVSESINGKQLSDVLKGDGSIDAPWTNIYTAYNNVICLTDSVYGSGSRADGLSCFVGGLYIYLHISGIVDYTREQYAGITGEDVSSANLDLSNVIVDFEGCEIHAHSNVLRDMLRIYTHMTTNLMVDQTEDDSSAPALYSHHVYRCKLRVKTYITVSATIIHQCDIVGEYGGIGASIIHSSTIKVVNSIECNLIKDSTISCEYLHGLMYAIAYNCTLTCTLRATLYAYSCTLNADVDNSYLYNCIIQGDSTHLGSTVLNGCQAVLFNEVLEVQSALNSTIQIKRTFINTLTHSALFIDVVFTTLIHNTNIVIDIQNECMEQLSGVIIDDSNSEGCTISDSSIKVGTLPSLCGTDGYEYICLRIDLLKTTVINSEIDSVSINCE